MPESPAGFDKYWEAVVAKNPDLATSDRMTITIASFKAMQRQAFRAGVDKSETISNLFKGIFDRNPLKGSVDKK